MLNSPACILSCNTFQNLVADFACLVKKIIYFFLCLYGSNILPFSLSMLRVRLCALDTFSQTSWETTALKDLARTHFLFPAYEWNEMKYFFKLKIQYQLLPETIEILQCNFNIFQYFNISISFFRRQFFLNNLLLLRCIFNLLNSSDERNKQNKTNKKKKHEIWVRSWQWIRLKYK